MWYQSLLGFFHSKESEDYDKKVEKAKLDANEQLAKNIKAPEGYKVSTNPENLSDVAPVSPWPERWKWNEAWAPEPER